MICNINNSNKEAAVRKVYKIMSERKEKSPVKPDKLLKVFYVQAFQDLVRQGDTNAKATALATTQFVSNNLLEIYKVVTKKILGDLSGEVMTVFSPEIEKAMLDYNNIDRIKELVGEQDILPDTPVSSVTREQVEPYLNKIKEAFPQGLFASKEFVGKTKTLAGDPAKWMFSTMILNEKEVKLVEVSKFLDGKVPISSNVILNESYVRAGNLIDFVFRQYIKHTGTFSEFKAKISSNTKFVSLLTDYTSGDEDITLLDAEIGNSFLNSISSALYDFKKQYENSYITDLSELLKSQDRFWLYDTGLGLKGELDFLAINPDGTFRVIDIKSTSRSSIDFSRYKKQVSVYSKIVEQRTGLKSDGKIDIYLVSIENNNPAISMGEPVGSNTIYVSNYEKHTFPTLDEKQLLKEIQSFNKKVDSFYIKNELKKTNFFLGKSLRMTNIKSEPLVTPEDFETGLNWLKRVFPELDNDSAIQVIKAGNSDIAGRFFLDGIQLFTRANRGAAYHEGWHRFSQLYLTIDQKMELYSKLREKAEDFISRDNRKLNTSTASLQELEEYAAEKFKDYALERQKDYALERQNKKPKSFIEKIFDSVYKFLEWLSNFFKSKGDFAIEELFENLYNGSYYKGSYSASNALFSVLDMKNKEGTIRLDFVTFTELRDMIDYEIADHLRNNGQVIGHILSKDNGIDVIVDIAKRNLILYYETNSDLIDRFESEIDTVTDPQEKEILKAKINYLRSVVDKLSVVLEKDGDVYTNIDEFITTYLKFTEYRSIRQFLSKVSKRKLLEWIHHGLEDQIEKDVEDDQTDEEMEEGEVMPSEYDKKPYVDPYTILSPEVKDFFIGIKRMYPEDNTYKPRFGNFIPFTMSSREAFNRTLEILHGSQTFEKIKRNLSNPANRSAFREMDQVYDRLFGVQNGVPTGIFSRLEYLTDRHQNSQLDSESKLEFEKLSQFYDHFIHVLASVRKVDHEVFTLRLNQTEYDTDSQFQNEAVSMREALDLGINNLVGEYVNGFAKNADAFKNIPRSKRQASINSRFKPPKKIVKRISDKFKDTSLVELNKLLKRVRASYNASNGTTSEFKRKVNEDGSNTLSFVEYNRKGVPITDYDILRSSDLENIIFRNIQFTESLRTSVRNDLDKISPIIKLDTNDPTIFDITEEEDADDIFGISDITDEAIPDVYSVLAILAQEPYNRAKERISSFEYIMDEARGKYLFNPLYINSLIKNARGREFQYFASNPNIVYDVLTNLGINVSELVYEDASNPNGNYQQLVGAFVDLVKLLYKQIDTFERNVESLARDKNYINRLNEYFRFKSAIKAELAKETVDEGRVKSFEMNLRTERERLVGRALLLFSPSIVNDILFQGKDKQFRSKPENRIFAIARPVLEKIARVDRKFRTKFTSGSIVTSQGLQYAYFLPNQMTLVESLVNEQIGNVNDFAKLSPNLDHLDPTKRPEIMNSYFYKQLFDENGDRRANIKIGLANISDITFIYENDSIESKKLSKMISEEYMLIDFLMLAKYGTSEIRRLETSDTAYRQYISVDGRAKKPVDFRASSSKHFREETFLDIVRGYIQHASVKYKYYRDPKNREKNVQGIRDPKTGKLKVLPGESLPRIDQLGVFDGMLPRSIDKLKKFIEEYKGHPNSLMQDLLKKDRDLFIQINDEIVNYFEDLSINKPNSYKNTLKKELSTKSRYILNRIASINPSFIYMITKKGEQEPFVADNIIKEVIANDFIQTMEDALLFFGDYTFYEDPAKRRKIIGNNGSVDLTDSMRAKTKQVFHQHSLEKLYQDMKGIKKERNHKVVRKLVIKDYKVMSHYMDGIDDGKIPPMFQDLLNLEKYTFGNTKSDEEILKDLKEKKKYTIEGFKKMQIADGAALISLSKLRTMLQKEHRWTPEMSIQYERQMLILKEKLGETLSTSDKRFIKKNAYKGVFNLAKFALTGPVLGDMPFHPTFDKMGLRVLLPEFDFDRESKFLFEAMLEHNIDYVVFDSGSKGFTPNPLDIYDIQNSTTNPKEIAKIEGSIVEHAGMFFKNQQNTSVPKLKSPLSIQLRGIFNEIRMVMEKKGTNNKERLAFLRSKHLNLVKMLTEHISITSASTFAEMGADSDGNIVSTENFVNFIKRKLIKSEKVDKEQLELLNEAGIFDNVADLATQTRNLPLFIEALPFHPEIFNVFIGVLDDVLRKIELNGSKLYQAPELTGRPYPGKDRPGKLVPDSTLGLRWHRLEYDSNGRPVRTLEVESRINMSAQWRPLYRLKHNDGNSIKTLSRLNEMLLDDTWVDKHRYAITFTGIRIPMQDSNFSSHIIVREFLPESTGDTIMLPPEFYVQTGGDNDIDSITSSFKYLDALTGLVIKRPVDQNGTILDYKYITSEIDKYTRLVEKENEGKATTAVQFNSSDSIRLQKIEFLKNRIKEEGFYEQYLKIPFNPNDFELRKYDDGTQVFDGFKNNKGNLYKLFIKKNVSPEIYDLLMDVQKDHAIQEDKVSENEVELRRLREQRKAYKKGLVNDIIHTFIEFAELPESYDLLTETDSIDPIKEVVVMLKNLRGEKVNGRDVEIGDLSQPKDPLTSMSKMENFSNHRNNSELRSILGSVVKFRRILSNLADIDAYLSASYKMGSLPTLMDNPDDKDKKSRAYDRSLRIPLLYNKKREQILATGLPISVYNEDGNRSTKELSMLVSSLLDVFKNKDVFPSLGVTWLEIKSLLYLTAQGVPMKRSILFLNNPIVEEVRKSLVKLGTGAAGRHALVDAAQTIFDDEIFPKDSKGFVVSNGDYLSGSSVNMGLWRHGKVSEVLSSLEKGGGEIKFTEEELKAFISAYSEYSSQNNNPSIKLFIYRNPQYKDLAKNIMLYYSTLMEDGDLFYKTMIKQTNRDAAKYNNRGAIASAASMKIIRTHSGMVKSNMKVVDPNGGGMKTLDFEEALENYTVHSPFYNDKKVINLLRSLTPNIFVDKDEQGNIQFDKDGKIKTNTLLERLYNDIVGQITSAIDGSKFEYKIEAERRVSTDFIDAIVKNFYYLTESRTIDGREVLVGNTLYNWYGKDITPGLAAARASTVFKKMNENSHSNIKEIGFDKAKFGKNEEEERMEVFANDGLFTSQIDAFKTKYKELVRLPLIEALSYEKKSKVPSGGRGEWKDFMNEMDQIRVYLNIPANSDDRILIEPELRKNFEDLLMFNIENFPYLKDSMNQERLDFYTRPEVIREIREFIKRTALLSLAQTSHTSTYTGSFSHLVPFSLVNNIVGEAITNFTDFIGTLEFREKDSFLKGFMSSFGKMFRDMNPDLEWYSGDETPPPKAIPESDDMDDTERGDYYEPGSENTETIFGGDEEGEAQRDPTYYKAYAKPQTGKLYGLMLFMRMQEARDFAMRRKGISQDMRGFNEFVINPFEKEPNPFECKIN